MSDMRPIPNDPGRSKWPNRKPLMAAAAGVLAALAVTAIGCGDSPDNSSSKSAGSASPSATAHATARGDGDNDSGHGASNSPAAASQARAFTWLRPSPPPRAWHTSQLPGGVARLAYPLGWQSIRSDPGTFSAAVRAPTGEIRGYLNATPRQGAETLAVWGRFRIDHNREEGDVDVKPIASATNLRFRRGHGSCVIDTYTSSSGRGYREVACIVAGARATTVVVGAAPPAQWPRQGPAIERAISSFLT